MGTCKSRSWSGIRRKRRFIPAVGSCTNSTKSCFVSATLPPPSPASWIAIASSLVSTGKHASSISTILSSSPPRGRNANLKLCAEKCAFAAKEVSYLGHRVMEEGLLPDPALLTAIQEIPPPKTATEIRSFLGLAGYYRRYVKNFAAIANPLHALTRKDAVFHWSADCQDAFDRLKTLLTTSPITAFLDFSQSFRLYMDASTAGLGAIRHRSARAGSASSAALLGHSTRLRRPTPLPN